MLLNDLNSSNSRKMEKINKLLREHFGFTLASKIETGKLDKLYTKIADDLYNLKLDLSNVRSKDYAQKLLVAEGLRMMIEERNDRIEALRESHLVGPGARRYEMALNAASADVTHACEVGDDYEDAIRDAMKDYRSSELRFPDEMFEFDLRDMTKHCTLDSQIAQYEGMPMAELEEALPLAGAAARIGAGALRGVASAASSAAGLAADAVTGAVDAMDSDDDDVEIEEASPLAKAARKYVPGVGKMQARKKAADSRNLAYDMASLVEPGKRGPTDPDAPFDDHNSVANRDWKNHHRYSRIAHGKKPFAREGLSEDAGHSILDIITPEELEELRGYVNDTIDPMSFIGSDVYDKLFQYYVESGEMPYGIAKAREGDPDQWILDRVQQDYADEVSAMEEMYGRSRDREAEREWRDTSSNDKAGSVADYFASRANYSQSNPVQKKKKSFWENTKTNNRKKNMKEGYIKQLRKLLEAEVEQAESIIAARGFSQELQDMVEKLGRLVNEDLPAVSEQMRDAYGADVATGFENAVGETLSSVMDSLKSSKQDIDNSVSSIADGQAPQAGTGMDEVDFDAEDELELGDEMGDESGLDLDDGDELDLELGDMDDEGEGELLGRAKKESVQRKLKLKKQIVEMKQKLAKIKSKRSK